MKRNQKEEREERVTFRMAGSIQFDKTLKSANFVSLGNFEMTMDDKVVQFDFEEYASQIDDENPSILHFECRNPDYEVFKDLCHITKRMLQNVSEICEFNIDVESPDDSPILPIALKEVVFVLPYDLENIEITEEVLKAFTF